MQNGNIAVARSFGMVLNADGSVTYLNTTASPSSRFVSHIYVKIAAAFNGII